MRAVITIATILAMSLSCMAQNRIKSSFVWDIDDVSAVVKEDSIEVTLKYMLIDDGVDRNSYVTLTPVLKWIDKEYRMTSLSVCGLDLKSSPQSGIAMMSGKPRRIVEVRSKVPYDIGMNHFSISVSLTEFRSNKEYKGERRQIAVFSRKPRPELMLKPYIVEPPVMTSNERVAVFPLVLKYGSSKEAELDLDNKANYDAFDDFLASCTAIVLDSRTRVSSIEMSCYTSIIGNENENKKIASSRLRNVITCLVKQRVFGKKKITAGYVGEDWKSIGEWIEKSSWNDDSRLRSIVWGPQTSDQKEYRLKTDFEDLWSAMGSTLFSHMERIVCTIRYSMIDISDPKELLDAYRTYPGFLEPRDFYRVLSFFEPYSYGWNEVLLKCAEAWPQSYSANINAASMLLSNGRVHEAGAFLRRSGDSDDARYMRAVQLYSLGNAVAAEELLKGLSDEREIFRDAKKVFNDRQDWEQSPTPWNVQTYGFGKNWQ